MGDLEQMRVTYEFLRQITGKFRTRIGKGSSGVVYKGEGTDGQELAVKVLHHHHFALDFGEILTTSAEVKHPNIMQLLAYCDETKMEHVNYNGNIIHARKVYRALCFEYMHNGSLRQYLYDDGNHGLGWRERYRIIKGICEGLKHLHTGFKTRFVHSNLKPDNILLDKNMVPKLADFPLSRGSTERFGSHGYLPPEFMYDGVISHKGDIFSLGLIIIEIIVGRMGDSHLRQMGPDSFSEHVCNKWRTRLQAIPGYTTLDADCQQVRSCIQIALTCISENRHDRPAIGAIVEELDETEKHINYSTGWTEEVVQTSQGLYTQTVHEDSGNMKLNILELIVNGSEEPCHLDLALLQNITQNFSEKNKIGSGGCGIVYKGILRNGIVAVKRLRKIWTIKDSMFHREVISLISVKQQNIVRFIGYCSVTEEHATLLLGGRHVMADIRERLLCFEYIRNGSLENHLTDELRGLEWQTRYQIIIGICRGLNYLQKDKEIIHMDLKPSNILLDDLMVPKITDFGLSRPESDSQATATRFISRGYTAPEYISGGKATRKSDIYSLGVIIIELVTGSKTVPNITKVIRRWNHRWIKSMKQSLLAYQQVKKCLELALRCIQDDPTDRPNISDIIDELKEIDTKDGQTQIQISPSCLEDILGIEPLEIHIAFGDLKISHSIELTNDTDDYIAFVTKAKLERFYTEPERGIVLPRSKCSVTLAMQAQVSARPNEHYTEVITVLSTRVDDGALATMDIVTVGDIFIDSEEGKVVDEVNVMVVFGRPQLPEE